MVSVEGFPQSKEQDTEVTSAIVYNIFSQFKDHVKIIHYDNSSTKLLGTVLKNNSFMLFNYDLLHCSLTIVKDRRPYLHLLLVNKNVLDDDKVKAKNVKNIDTVMFLIMRKEHAEVGKICSRPNLYQAESVFVYSPETHEAWMCCYFCDQRLISSRNIKVVESDIPEFRKYAPKYLNFDGYQFKVGYTEMIPLIYRK